nr:Nif3-like dinuclear metal center hexameric protein [Methanomicrobium sp. W14]
MALDNDKIGLTDRTGDCDFEVEKVLVLMDYLSPGAGDFTDYDSYDLLILHHPPAEKPPLPAYVIHSNWDIVRGGACDALADCLNVISEEVLDENTGLGRIGTLKCGPVPLSEFCRDVMEKLGINFIRTVNYRGDVMIERISLVSGFGLKNPGLIEKAQQKGADLFLSGDLVHSCAVAAKNSGFVLLDASHYATELPGLYKLGRVIEGLGVKANVIDTKIPWTVIH